ncbi:nitrite reductase large subunit NirB [Marinobacterium sediminicola]|uniref:Nitrite reductase (NADH) large subunit n=1 Tax=Marinobacterium sediminicola TaxID=518898 RepID=A0ABY1S2M8_9GAMM|nr:nitrite reductase large subunit NirB [Marinobacterium sediminicola]ULG68506.1 nitrite reductase large subunit NirB [Marinobacterium sediminicola]SMR76683.1 nitrite reductase (NADH) large subunit [Marinobacterium sediminicola]
MKQRLIVIGNGMVGHHFVEQWLASEAAEDYELTVFGAERQPAYDRVHLSEYFEQQSADHLYLGEPGFYQQPGIELRLGEAVTAIDPADKTVSTELGEYAFDKLVLATGSYPFVPPIPGGDQPHCLVYRTLDDLDAIRASADGVHTGVVIGGGLLGLEAANALKSLGLDVHVVEFAPRLMPVQLDEEAGAMLRRKIEALGVAVHTDKATREIVSGESARMKMCFADETALETDLIVFSAGIRPQDALAKAAGLALGERGGVDVDQHCRTSHPDIYAIGECAVWNGRHFGLVAPGYTMARAAVSHLNDDGKVHFQGADMSTKLKLLGVDVGSIGDAHGHTPGCKNYRYTDERTGVYRRLVVSEDGKHLLGAILIGDNSYYDPLLQLALNDMPLPEHPEALILPASEGGLPTVGSAEVPMTATICSCHNVSKGDICEAMNDGAVSVADLKASTKAATGCGGCAAMLKTVLDAELEKRGVQVDRSLCVHFSHTRQELFHLIRVGQIKSFGELISRHGSGGGCEICKPAVASILASCWNEHVHTPDLLPLQDTNDTFMANMQKNGTYSVVPRIPGGEITPKMLIALGEVGDKYQLYTKITGGQRIDLFGATLDELPLIWEELIAAGFETGHAYGKSLRTVKSCVGSTWCRFGVQDSVGMAIEIENRYKGLRAPHKVKMAVSGCTRECAEAQSKDIGVIATENGWNLYVCGNGGMKPRHADLFATDLDDETLVRYIDRILMFYIYTADRLQRTSVWMENLEGGLDYLRQVVIDDSLGLAAELEARMQHVVDSYRCEWKEAVEDPTKRKRFRSFVNSDEPGRARIVQVVERGQLIPARELAVEEA